MSRSIILVLVYHRHTLLDLKSRLYTLCLIKLKRKINYTYVGIQWKVDGCALFQRIILLLTWRGLGEPLQCPPVTHGQPVRCITLWEVVSTSSQFLFMFGFIFPSWTVKPGAVFNLFLYSVFAAAKFESPVSHKCMLVKVISCELHVLIKLLPLRQER
jgi:hypothetical protein